jgi:hypothetical protein
VSARLVGGYYFFISFSCLAHSIQQCFTLPSSF